MRSILLINVVSRATLKNMGAKRSFKNFDTSVTGACIHATMGRNGVSGYKKRKEYKFE
jgi:hypothetical protein